MGILIKNMKMPKNCGRCWFNKSSLSCAITGSYIDRDDENRERLDDCPFVEVPESHGRLIEAPNISEYEVFDEDTGTREISLLGLMECYRMVKDAKIVIEAEGE